MDIKDDAELPEERPSSPIWVLQHLSGEAFRVAGEALHSVSKGSASLREMGSGHRRSQSEVVTAGYRRNNSFQRFKTHMQKAWRWGSSIKEEDYWSSFNPEVLATQKRQWYLRHSKSLNHVKYQEPTSLFEHFIIVGLHPDANLEIVEDGFARRKKWEVEMAKSDVLDFAMSQHQSPSLPVLEPQILFKYPPGKRLAIRMKDLAAFCFPGGVKARLLERTPSLSDLNQLVYGQEHLNRDDLSFVFSLKVADNATLYGVCLHVPEIVQRRPGILGTPSSLSQSPRTCSRFLVSAPRCYCILTRIPFFELHYEMLSSIIAQERLNRIIQFVNEMSLTDYVPSISKVDNQMNESVNPADRELFNDWMASAIPVDSAVALTAAAAGIISEHELSTSSLKISEFRSPESVTTSEASEISQMERVDGSWESCQTSPEVNSFLNNYVTEQLGSSESGFSPVRSLTSEEEDDEFFLNQEKDFSDDLIMEWAKENKNDLLQIVCGYHSLPLPARGGVIVFQPLAHLQSIEYMRTPCSALGFSEKYLESSEAAEIKGKLVAAEEAHALSIWTTATICRALSLESVLALVAGVLLEKQVVVVCPNLGVLSALVLSLIPLICPFQWQSLLLPILPGQMLEFLEAPVPFIVGLQYKPIDLRMKASNLVHVNVHKDQVKTCNLPTLPQYKELFSDLWPIHAQLAKESSNAKKHPVYKCNELQTELAAQFLNVMQRYMESLCSDLRSHTITSVQSNNDRVSLLLKDSFIHSFSSKDQPFIKQFVETQLFSVLSDSRLSSFENEYSSHFILKDAKQKAI